MESEETINEDVICEHKKWAYSQSMISDIVEIGKVYRTCAECGLHQRADINWANVDE